MCSISGCLVDSAKIDSFYLRDIIKKAQERGRDSCGIYIDGTLYSSIEKGVIPKIPISIYEIAINNNRAEPTTEYVENKTDKDVQPFVTKRFVVAHNGTIANDKELIKKYSLKTVSKIDSAVIAPLLEKIWNGTVEHLIEVLRDEIVGSYAMAIWDKKTHTLYLAVNYKPLFITFKGDTIYFSSLRKYLNTYDNKIVQVPPYSLLVLKGGQLIQPHSLWRPAPEKDKKVLVICSGGLDSVVTATYLKDQGYDVTLVHFVYGCRAEKKEIQAVKDVSDYLNMSYLLVPLDIFKTVIGHSRLTNTKDQLADGEASAELAWEWVPARNLIMYSIATALAESRGVTYIALGNNLEESGAYPDNEMIFAQKFNDILPYATNLQNRVEMLQPVGNLMKHEIVKMGLELKAPLHLTWSCYEGRDLHCGVCGPCYMRKKAFIMNKVEDCIKYEN